MRRKQSPSIQLDVRCDTSACGVSVMLNWIGKLPDASAVLKEPHAHWHDYGKQPRDGRKVGHATICASDADELRSRLARVVTALGREQQVAPVLDAIAGSR